MGSFDVGLPQDLFERELANLMDEVLALKLAHRAELDRLTYEIETLRRLVRKNQPGSASGEGRHELSSSDERGHTRHVRLTEHHRRP